VVSLPPETIGMTALELRKVSKRFLGLQALEDVSFSIRAGELVALIGPNGAGKSTLINIIAGDQAASSGAVFFAGQDLSGLPPHAVNARGLTRTYQAAEIFGRLSVLENVMVGGVRSTSLTMTESLLMLPSARRKRARLRGLAQEALVAAGLSQQAGLPGNNLSAGHQRLLAIARALATGNDWLILDEPGAGLNHVEKLELVAVIRMLSERGKTILFVEHDMGLVGDLAERILVIDRGRLIADGRPQDVRQDRRVIDAYLGVPQAVQHASTGRTPPGAPLLEAKHLVVRYGANAALNNVTLQVPAKSIVAVVGPNGAGKSTLLKALIRVIPIAAGDVRLAGRAAANMTVHEMVSAGVALAPEGRELFASLSVLDNLVLGAYTRRSAWLGRPLTPGSRQAIDGIFALFPRLADRRKQLAGTLSGGEGQMLAVGRALMSEPRVLMLDEPSLGLAPIMVAEIFKALVSLRDEGLTILLVEQNARAALEIADRGYVIETGRIVADDDAQALLTSPEIALAYLGGAAKTRALTPTR
jgi:branched-chain amino acid transport system ATP-binding protein